MPRYRGELAEYGDGEGEGISFQGLPAWFAQHKVVLLGLGLIIVELVWKAQFLHHFYFRQDDFHFTELGLQYGLSWKYLGYVGSGHLHPGVLLLVWVLAKSAPYDWTAATWMSLVLVGIASLACLRMLRTLMGDRMAVLIPLTLFLATPLTLPDDSWWSSAIESLPLQIAIFLTVTSHVHYVRSGRFRHALAAAYWLIVGLFFFEKAVAIPVVLFALTAAFLVDGKILASVRLALTRYVRAWALYIVIIGGYLLLLLHTLHQSTVKPKPTSASATLTFSWSLIRETLLPGLLGGPWAWAQQANNNAIAYVQPTATLAWLAAFVVCAVIVLTVAVNRRAWRAWAILALWVLVADVVPMLLGRLATAGFAQILALDTRYVADAAPVAALAVALAFWPVRGGEAMVAPRRERPAPDYFPGPVWRAVGVAVALVVVFGSAVSASRYEKATQLYNYAGNGYLHHARASLQDLSPGTVIADRPMSPVVMWNIYYLSYANQSIALAPLESTATRRNVHWAEHFDGNITRLMMFDPYGRLIDAVVSGVRVTAKGCARFRNGVATLAFPQPAAPTSGIVRIGYLAGPADAGESVSVRYGSTTLPLILQQGLHSAYLSVSGSSAEVTVTKPASGGFCIGDVEAGNLKTLGS